MAVDQGPTYKSAIQWLWNEFLFDIITKIKITINNIIIMPSNKSKRININAIEKEILQLLTLFYANDQDELESFFSSFPIDTLVEYIKQALPPLNKIQLIIYSELFYVCKDLYFAKNPSRQSEPCLIDLVTIGTKIKVMVNSLSSFGKKSPNKWVVWVHQSSAIRRILLFIFDQNTAYDNAWQLLEGPLMSLMEALTLPYPALVSDKAFYMSIKDAMNYMANLSMNAPEAKEEKIDLSLLQSSIQKESNCLVKVVSAFALMYYSDDPYQAIELSMFNKQLAFPAELPPSSIDLIKVTLAFGFTECLIEKKGHRSLLLSHADEFVRLGYFPSCMQVDKKANAELATYKVLLVLANEISRLKNRLLSSGKTWVLEQMLFDLNKTKFLKFPVSMIEQGTLPEVALVYEELNQFILQLCQDNKLDMAHLVLQHWASKEAEGLHDHALSCVDPMPLLTCYRYCQDQGYVINSLEELLLFRLIHEHQWQADEQFLALIDLLLTGQNSPMNRFFLLYLRTLMSSPFNPNGFLELPNLDNPFVKAYRNVVTENVGLDELEPLNYEGISNHWKVWNTLLLTQLFLKKQLVLNEHRPTITQFKNLAKAQYVLDCEMKDESCHPLSFLRFWKKSLVTLTVNFDYIQDQSAPLPQRFFGRAQTLGFFNYVSLLWFDQSKNEFISSENRLFVFLNASDYLTGQLKPPIEDTKYFYSLLLTVCLEAIKDNKVLAELTSKHFDAFLDRLIQENMIHEAYDLLECYKSITNPGPISTKEHDNYCRLASILRYTFRLTPLEQKTKIDVKVDELENFLTKFEHVTGQKLKLLIPPDSPVPTRMYQKKSSRSSLLVTPRIIKTPLQRPQNSQSEEKSTQYDNRFFSLPVVPSTSSNHLETVKFIARTFIPNPVQNLVSSLQKTKGNALIALVGSSLVSLISEKIQPYHFENTKLLIIASDLGGICEAIGQTRFDVYRASTSSKGMNLFLTLSNKPKFDIDIDIEIEVIVEVGMTLEKYLQQRFLNLERLCLLFSWGLQVYPLKCTQDTLLSIYNKQIIYYPGKFLRPEEKWIILLQVARYKLVHFEQDQSLCDLSVGDLNFGFAKLVAYPESYLYTVFLKTFRALFAQKSTYKVSQQLNEMPLFYCMTGIDPNLIYNILFAVNKPTDNAYFKIKTFCLFVYLSYCCVFKENFLNSNLLNYTALKQFILHNLEEQDKPYLSLIEKWIIHDQVSSEVFIFSPLLNEVYKVKRIIEQNNTQSGIRPWEYIIPPDTVEPSECYFGCGHLPH